jgi:hypothetical protein
LPVINNPHQGKHASFVERARQRDYLARRSALQFAAPEAIRGTIMSRVLASLSAAAFLALAAVPTAAFAGCYGCYVPRPQPCVTCYQQQIIPPQYQTYNETVMVSPGQRIPHRIPARYETVMVPQTRMVAPESVQFEDVPPQYTTVQRTQMVAPARAVVVPVRPRCSTCGW